MRLFALITVLALLYGCAAETQAPAPEAHAHDQLLLANPADYSAVLAFPTSEIGKPLALNVKILRKDGSVPHFLLIHERLLHVMLIRDDLQHFAHTHPEESGTVDTQNGIFTFEHAFAAPGKYRVMLEFLDHDKQVAIPLDLEVPGAADAVPLEEPSRTSETDGYAVNLTAPNPLRAGKESSLAFTITKDTTPITPEPYLGEPLHLAVWSEGLSYFKHAHPDISHGELHFHMTFPAAGQYKLFAQFKHKGKIITAPFVVRVE
jgi:hypothetical protein